MAQFNDKSGRAWTIALDIAALRRVRSDLRVNLADLLILGPTRDADEPLARRLERDPVLLVDLLFVLCKPQCGERGVDDEAFAALFDGACIDAATAALLEAVDDFFRRPASKLALEWTRRQQARAKETPKLFASLTNEEWDAVFDGAIAVALENRFGDTLFEWAGMLGVDPDRFTARELSAAVAGRGRVIADSHRAGATNTALLMAMLANCHRLGMDRFDSRGNRQPGPHSKPWRADEFLPDEYRSRRRQRDDREIIQGSINCLKMFVPPGSDPVEMPRSSFTVIDEADLVLPLTPDP